MLNPTPLERLVDKHGRPYFLWDNELTLVAFQALLVDPDADVRARSLARLMRQAKPDDVMMLVSPRRIAQDLAVVWPYLGDNREFWAFWVDAWRQLGVVDG